MYASDKRPHWQRAGWTAILTVTCVAESSAQRAEENAVKKADDAFGVTIGRETLGVYSSESVRGFSPAAAGNTHRWLVFRSSLEP